MVGPTQTRQQTPAIIKNLHMASSRVACPRKAQPLIHIGHDSFDVLSGRTRLAPCGSRLYVPCDEYTFFRLIRCTSVPPTEAQLWQVSHQVDSSQTQQCLVKKEAGMIAQCRPFGGIQDVSGQAEPSLTAKSEDIHTMWLKVILHDVQPQSNDEEIQRIECKTFRIQVSEPGTGPGARKSGYRRISGPPYG